MPFVSIGDDTFFVLLTCIRSLKVDTLERLQLFVLTLTMDHYLLNLPPPLEYGSGSASASTLTLDSLVSTYYLSDESSISNFNQPRTGRLMDILFHRAGGHLEGLLNSVSSAISRTRSDSSEPPEPQERSGGPYLLIGIDGPGDLFSSANSAFVKEVKETIETFFPPLSNGRQMYCYTKVSRQSIVSKSRDFGVGDDS